MQNQIPQPDSFTATSEQQPFTQSGGANGFFSGLLNVVQPVATAVLDFEQRKAEIKTIQTPGESAAIEARIPQGNQAPVARAPMEGFLNPQNAALMVGVGLLVGFLILKRR